MKVILLVLVLFLVGCVSDSSPSNNGNNNNNNGDNNNPPLQEEECKYVPFKGRKLGEMRSISLTQEGNNFLYDFTGLGLCDENYNEFIIASIYYYRETTSTHRSELLSLVKGSGVSWFFNEELIFTKDNNYFKASLEGEEYNYLNNQKVSIHIDSSYPYSNKIESIDLFYKGLSVSGEVQLVGIERKIDLHYVCEGDCFMDTPYVPIPIP